MHVCLFYLSYKLQYGIIQFGTPDQTLAFNVLLLPDTLVLAVFFCIIVKFKCMYVNASFYLLSFVGDSDTQIVCPDKDTNLGE